MNRWEFRSYVSNQGDEVRLWYDDQVETVRAELTTIVGFLRDQPKEFWECQDYKTLTGPLFSLGEIRIIVNNVHYRILGFRDDGAMEFTMLIPARKTRHFSYKTIGGVALRRMSEVKSYRAKFSQKADWIPND